MFKRANGMKYVRFMDALHRDVLFDWYLEVGCRTGRIFARSRGKTIAVDPFFRAEQNIIGPKPSLFLFQQTSDDFFDSGVLQALKAKLSFSFLDGMHLFEFLLRDFIGVEKASSANSVIALHDCCPFDLEMTTRDLDNLPKHAWTGDVWKLIPILQTYRPDLKITVLDASPTGLVLVSGLDPKSKVLERAYPKIIKEFADLNLEDFGVERFFDLFDYDDTAAFIASGYPLFAQLRLDDSLVLNPTRVTP